jgi:hypothetical protein
MIRIDEVLHELERAWEGSLPGRQSCERDAVLRELQRLLQQQPAGDQAAPRLRLMRC